MLHRGPVGPGLAPCTAKDAGATALCAALPITPARAFEAGELVEGKVHLDILAGREGVRGKVGGTEAVKVESAGGEASVFVPAQALPRNTAVAVETSELSSYLPSAGGVVALAELVVDFSGQTLALGAELRRFQELKAKIFAFQRNRMESATHFARLGFGLAVVRWNLEPPDPRAPGLPGS